MNVVGTEDTASEDASTYFLVETGLSVCCRYIYLTECSLRVPRPHKVRIQE